MLSENLHIVAVDLDRDAAFLASSDLERMGKNGFEVVMDTFDPSSLKSQLRVEGMPRGAEGLGSSVQVNYPIMGRLKDIVPDNIVELFNDRNSPSLSADVLRVKGLEPGDSGGPILDTFNRVLAMADGGLAAGASKVCWAIIYRDIHWVSVSKLSPLAKNRLLALETEAGNELFTFETTPAVPGDSAPTEPTVASPAPSLCTDEPCESSTARLVEESPSEFDCPGGASARVFNCKMIEVVFALPSEWPVPRYLHIVIMALGDRPLEIMTVRLSSSKQKQSGEVDLYRGFRFTGTTTYKHTMCKVEVGESSIKDHIFDIQVRDCKYSPLP